VVDRKRAMAQPVSLKASPPEPIVFSLQVFKSSWFADHPAKEKA
jgi:hypothetical protein